MGPAVDKLEADGWAMMVVGSHKTVAESVPIGVTALIVDEDDDVVCAVTGTDVCEGALVETIDVATSEDDSTVADGAEDDEVFVGKIVVSFVL